MAYIYLDLYKLHLFLRAAQAGSFSAAATQFAISQPAVSQHIRDLELQLGVALFERRRRGVQLTPHGERLRHYAERLLALASEAQREIANLENAADTQLAVGATPGIGHYVLPGWLAHFHAQHPRVKVSIHSGTTESIGQLLQQRRVEIGLIEGEPWPTSPGMTALALGEIPQLLVVGPKHRFWSRVEPVTLQELDGEAMVAREPNSQTRAWMDALFAQHRVQPRIVAESDSPAAIKHLVERSATLALLPQYVLDDELSSGRLQAVPLRPPLTRTLRATWMNDEPLSLQAHAFIQHIIAASQAGWTSQLPSSRRTKGLRPPRPSSRQSRKATGNL
ncbi:MAG: LysR family transcriptional regulator [Thermoflexales bacterium]